MQVAALPDAARSVRLVGLVIGIRVLEPSDGTRRPLGALLGIVPFGQSRQAALHVVAVEVNPLLAIRLACSGPADTEDLGMFDAVMINPPFAPGDAMAQIMHALKMP